MVFVKELVPRAAIALVALGGKPASAFLADGSEVSVSRGVRLERSAGY